MSESNQCCVIPALSIPPEYLPIHFRLSWAEPGVKPQSVNDFITVVETELDSLSATSLRSIFMSGANRGNLYRWGNYKFLAC